MFVHPTLILALLPSLSSPGEPLQDPPARSGPGKRVAPAELTLEMAQGDFAAADLDGSRALEVAEARSLGLKRYAIRGYDVDKSGALERDEFIVAARMEAASKRRRVARDLEAEVTRILARRRAREAELRCRTPQTKPIPGAVEPGAVKLGGKAGAGEQPLPGEPPSTAQGPAEQRSALRPSAARASLRGSTGRIEPPQAQEPAKPVGKGTGTPQPLGSTAGGADSSSHGATSRAGAGNQQGAASQAGKPPIDPPPAKPDTQKPDPAKPR